MPSHYGIEGLMNFDPRALLNFNYGSLPAGGNPIGYPAGTIPLDPKTGRPYTATPAATSAARGNSRWRDPNAVPISLRPTAGSSNYDNSQGEEEKKRSVFDPRIDAIDTTNPHALPIIELIKQFLMAQAARGPRTQHRAPGPMSQLYPNGIPQAKFDPVNAGSTQIRSFQPQYMNQHTANNFDAEALIRSL